MPRKNLSLGDLRELMEKYRKALGESKSTHRLDARGGTQEVDPERVKRATAALEAAITELESVCQDGVLAIIVDSES
jgi:hypothetical protein